jgi:hypothetical protein
MRITGHYCIFLDQVTVSAEPAGKPLDALHVNFDMRDSHLAVTLSTEQAAALINALREPLAQVRRNSLMRGQS